MDDCIAFLYPYWSIFSSVQKNVYGKLSEILFRVTGGFRIDGKGSLILELLFKDFHNK
jgi:hypothetical protein